MGFICMPCTTMLHAMSCCTTAPKRQWCADAKRSADTSVANLQDGTEESDRLAAAGSDAAFGDGGGAAALSLDEEEAEAQAEPAVGGLLGSVRSWLVPQGADPEDQVGAECLPPFIVLRCCPTAETAPAHAAWHLQWLQQGQG